MEQELGTLEITYVEDREVVVHEMISYGRAHDYLTQVRRNSPDRWISGHWTPVDSDESLSLDPTWEDDNFDSWSDEDEGWPYPDIDKEDL